MKVPRINRFMRRRYYLGLLALGIVALSGASFIAGRLSSHSLAASVPTKSSSVFASGGAVTPNTVTSKQTTHSSGAPASPTSTAAPSTACQVLTTQIAGNTIGTPLQDASSNTAHPVTTRDIETTTCVYTHTDASGMQQVRLVARIVRTSLGASENDTAFGSGRPAGVTSVSGYGQAAYWNAQAGELNILVNNNWYVLSRTHGSTAVHASLTDTETIAQHLKASMK